MPRRAERGIAISKPVGTLSILPETAQFFPAEELKAEIEKLQKTENVAKITKLLGMGAGVVGRLSSGLILELRDKRIRGLLVELKRREAKGNSSAE